MRHGRRPILATLAVLGVLAALPSAAVGAAEKLPPAVLQATVTYAAVAAAAGHDRWILPGMLVAPSVTALEVDRAEAGQTADYAAESVLVPGSPDLVKRFRWTSQTPRIDHVVWQVARLEYVSEPTDWRTPPGLVASGKTDQNPFPVDFGAIVSGLPAKATPLDRTFFVRAQPVDRSERALGTPSAPVRVQAEAPTAGDAGPVVWPTLRLTEYQPVRGQTCDAEYHAVVVRDPRQAGFHWPFAHHPNYSVGDKLDLTPQPGGRSWWDRVRGGAGSALGVLRKAASWVGDGYTEVKQQAVKVVGRACGAKAEGLFGLGLDLALAYCGLPPNVNDLGALSSSGQDRLVDLIADQTGLPRAVARLGLQAVLARVGTVAAKSWLAPDPEYRYRRAAVTVALTNPTGTPTTEGLLTVTPGSCDGSPRPFYRPGSVLVPALQPGEALSLEVALPESEHYRAWDSRTAEGAAQLRQWWESYAQGNMELTTSLTPMGPRADAMVGPRQVVRLAEAWVAP